MFDLNSMSCADGSGAPVDLFLGRNVNTFLPNAGNKFISMRRKVEKRKNIQENWMKKLGRVSGSDFKIGDLVCVHDTKTGVRSIKGEIEEVVDHDGGSKTYSVLGEKGEQYLRNGRFIKL